MYGEAVMETGNRLTERDAFWLEHLRACAEGSLKGYAEAHGLDVRALYDAKARLRRKGVLPSTRAPRLVRVEHRPLGDGPASRRVCFPNGGAVELARTLAPPLGRGRNRAPETVAL
jgi:hypothetical protein